MLGALMGRRSVSLSTLGRATTAARGVGRSMKEVAGRGARAGAASRGGGGDSPRSNADLEREIAALDDTSTPTAPLDVIEIKPKRGNVDIRLVALAWQPVAG